DAQTRRAFECGDRDSVDADRVWAVRGARSEDARKWDVGVSGRVGLEDVSVGEVEPGEQDQCVADADPMERVGEDGIDLEHGFGGALEGLVRGIRRRAQPRVDDADRAHGVRLDSVHRCTSLARAAVRVIQAPLWGRSKMWSARCRRGADGSYGTSWVCSGKDQ